MSFLMLLFAPLVIMLICYFFWPHKYQYWELGAQFGAQLVIIGIAVLLTMNLSLMDVEVWNGQVTSKQMVRVHCRHSYPCNCVTVSCGKDCSTTVCQTCYLHSFDQDWNVYSNIGKTWTINTIDSQGLQEPPRWTNTKIGEPVAHLESYKNYLKGNPDTLITKKGFAKKYGGQKVLPKYPLNKYDYWHLDRVMVFDGVPVEAGAWSRDLEALLGRIGPSKQCNAVIMLFKNKPTDYFYAIQEQWINGKKNDIIAVISVDDTNKIQWVQVMSLAKSTIINVRLRDALQAIGTLDKDKIMAVMETTIVNDFKRRSMDDFEYLNAGRVMTATQFMWLMILSICVSVGLSIYFIGNEYEDDDFDGQ